MADLSSSFFALILDLYYDVIYCFPFSIFNSFNVISNTLDYYNKYIFSTKKMDNDNDFHHLHIHYSSWCIPNFILTVILIFIYFNFWEKYIALYFFLLFTLLLFRRNNKQEEEFYNIISDFTILTILQFFIYIQNDWDFTIKCYLYNILNVFFFTIYIKIIIFSIFIFIYFKSFFIFILLKIYFTTTFLIANEKINCLLSSYGFESFNCNRSLGREIFELLY